MYDYIIVGSGIAGLYSAYKLSNQWKNQKHSERKKILIIEKSGKREMGGRMGNIMFHGVRVVTGAGIGRKDKDILLQQLLHELNIETHEFLVKNQYSPAIPPEHRINILEVLSLLKREYKSAKKRTGESMTMTMTFKEFAKPILGHELYKAFVTCTAYSDFENEDLTETLYHYGMEDNTNGWVGLSINWNKLLEVLYNKLIERGVEFKFNRTVDKIKGDEFFEGNKCSPCFTVHCSENTFVFHSKKIIIATTISSLKNLLPVSAFPLYKQIKGQPFLRLYGKFNGEYSVIMKERCFINTIVPGPLHRIIPYDLDKGVYMIAYTDNAGAEYFKRKNLLENTEVNREKICRIIEKSLRLPYKCLEMADMTSVYWEIGTHYYTPLDPNQQINRTQFIRKIQTPLPGITVVGEMVSRQQGWVEGALESVIDRVAPL